MTRIKSIAALAIVPLVAVMLGACGSDNGSGDTAPAKPAAHKSGTIGVANSDLGNILVDAQGRTVYLFEKDAGTKSACAGECAAAWPPVRSAGKPTAGSGLNASMLGTTKRSDGQPQVTYDGHPLYLFQGDSSPGDTNGQAITAFGAAWYVESPAGNAITSQSASAGGGSGY
jgi:predicted lipoprotein with Yx(FWY)xxD motif